MKESLQKAKEELFKRWVKAFDEIDNYSTYNQNTDITKYAQTSRFDIKNYENGKIEAGGELFDEKLDNDYREYGLDKSGFPTTCKFQHSFNKIEWVGFYKKENDLIEYVEFCLTTKIPSRIERIILKDGNKLSYQSLLINGGGTAINQAYLNLSTQELAEKIISDEYSLICNVEEYKYKDDKIIAAKGFFITPGTSDYTYEDAYSYDHTLSLDKIERFTENWPTQLIYIKPSGRTTEKLIDDLSSLLAAAIIEALGVEKIDEPVFNIQLNYHAVDNYWPYITMITEREKDDAIANKSESFFIEGSPVANEILRENAPDELDEMFAEFDQYVQSNEAWDMGSELLIKTSRIITDNKAKGKLPVSNEFIVFAVDWSMMHDPGEVEDVLIRCGADRNKVREWKELNWF